MNNKEISIEISDLMDILNGVKKKNNSEKFILEECSEENEEKKYEHIQGMEGFKTLAEILSYEIKR